MAHRIIRDIPRPDPDIIEQLRDLPPHAFGGPLTFGSSLAVDSAIKPIRDDMRVLGPAFTVMATSSDHLIPMYATMLARTGDVLVVDVGGKTDFGIWGAGMTRSAMLRGLAGVVIDGAVFGKPKLMELGLPIFARGTATTWTTWERAGSINVPVRCGGKVVYPGDLVVGDADGIVIIPRSRIAETVEVMARYREQLATWDKGIREGRTLFEILGLAEQIAKLRIAESDT